MSQSQRSKGGPGGSVRRARELMEAGLPLETPSSAQSPPRPRTGDVERGPGTASPARVRQPMPAALSASRGDGQSIGMAISRPTQVPQWPLAAPVQGKSSQGNTNQIQSGRGPAPQRPPRPSKSKVPSMLDASKLQDHTPTFQYTPQPSSSQQLGSQSRGLGESLTSSDAKSPLTPASRTSTVSSVGSIPDFPMPVPGPSDHPGSSGPARKSANLGPPPTARRGASSYYSNISVVSPIQEESPRTQQSHESYASSAAMPTTWRDDASDFLDDDESGERNIFSADPILEEGRDSRGSNGDDSSERGLVRSASIGRRGKPSMVTTKSADKTPPSSASPPLGSDKLAKMGVFGLMEMRAAQLKTAATAHANATGGRPSPVPVQNDQREPRFPIMGTTDSPLAGGTGFIESSSSESTSTLGRAITPKGADEKAFSPPPTFDPRMSKILHAHQAASGVQTGDGKELERSLSRLSAIRRPPKLDLNVVRDAEARGSLTSLPDLIRRATRLAAMIDKGKRPGSRLNNLNDFSDSDLAREKEEGALEGRRPQSGLSGMLAAFPPPGLATPREHSPRPQASWSTHIASTNAPLNPRGPSGSKPGRRCCGLPIWVFLVLILVTLLIVAAAVLVPLFLLVINKSSSNVSNTASQLAQCQQSIPCGHGGSSIISSNACSCICANGFTGPTCAVASSAGCTTTTITSSNGTVYDNVTLGESIPRLISGGKANFSIPLSSDLILGRFSSANLSCNAENALVTFDGRDWPAGSASSPASESGISTPTPTAKVVRVRRDFAFTSTTFQTTTSINPTIIIDTSTPPVGSATPTSTPVGAQPSTTNSMGTATSPSPSAAATASFILTQESIDFARVAVLYILQKQSVDHAVTAQSDIQSFFDTALTRGVMNSQAGNVTAGDGNSIDFWSSSLVLEGGERVGRS